MRWLLVVSASSARRNRRKGRDRVYGCDGDAWDGLEAHPTEEAAAVAGGCLQWRGVSGVPEFGLGGGEERVGFGGRRVRSLSGLMMMAVGMAMAAAVASSEAETMRVMVARDSRSWPAREPSPMTPPSRTPMDPEGVMTERMK